VGIAAQLTAQTDPRNPGQAGRLGHRVEADADKAEIPAIRAVHFSPVSATPNAPRRMAENCSEKNHQAELLRRLSSILSRGLPGDQNPPAARLLQPFDKWDDLPRQVGDVVHQSDRSGRCGPRSRARRASTASTRSTYWSAAVLRFVVIIAPFSSYCRSQSDHFGHFPRQEPAVFCDYPRSTRNLSVMQANSRKRRNKVRHFWASLILRDRIRLMAAASFAGRTGLQSYDPPSVRRLPLR